MKSLLPLLLFPAVVSAQTVTGSYFQSDDSDDANVYEYSASVMYDHVGVKVSHIRYKSDIVFDIDNIKYKGNGELSGPVRIDSDDPGLAFLFVPDGLRYSERGRRVAVIGQYSWDDTSVIYDVGVLNTHRNTVTGNVAVRHQIDPVWAVEVGAERSIVDSGWALGLSDFLDISIVGDTTYAVVEAATSGPGFVAVVGQTDYDFGDVRRFQKAKIYYTVNDTHGITPYIRRYQYTHSRPGQLVGAYIADDIAVVSSLYFSPSRYHQNLIGFSWRTAVAGGVFSGHLDYGRQTANGERFRSRTWRAAYTQQRESFSWSVVALSDHNQPEYRYSTFMAQINVPF